MKPYLIIFLFWNFLLSCNSKSEKDEINIISINEFNNKNTPRKDIPLNKLGEYDRTYVGMMTLLDTLKFERLDSGCEDFTIRIINNFDESDKLQIVSLKLREGFWTGKYYKVQNIKDSSSPQNIVDSNDITPKISWPSFIKKLITANILTLPNMETLSGFDKLVADGDLCFFEIASEKRYRFYYYYSPYLMVDWNYKECKNVIEIISVIKNNIDFHSRR